MARPRIDRTGQKIHHLTFIEFVSVDEKRRQLWLCLCDCGNKKIVNVHEVNRAGGTKSCGCMLDQRKVDTAFNQLYSKYKHGAKARGYEWNIDKNTFRKLTKGNCFYCGGAPSSVYTYNKYSGLKPVQTYMYNGLDRFYNDRDYDIHNIVACCKVCNYMKGTSNPIEFLEKIEDIYNHMQTWKEETR